MERMRMIGARAPLAALLALAFTSCGGIKSLPPSLASLAAQNLAVLLDSSNFGVVFVGSSSEKTVQLKNSSPQAVPLSLLNIRLVNAAAGYEIVSNTCSGTLAANSSCSLKIKFTPTQSLHGSLSKAGLKIDFQPTGSAGLQLEVPVQAESRTVASLSVTGPTTGGQYVIGSTPSALEYTVTNSGEHSASLSALGITNVNSTVATLARSSGGCGAKIDAGESCKLYVTPTLFSNGSFSANMSLPFDDGTGTRQRNWGFSASAARPASISLTVGDLNLGTMAVNTTLDRSFSFANTGDYLPTQFSVTASGGITVLSHTCATAMPCQVNARASYSTAGTQAGKISIAFFNGISNVTTDFNTTANVLNQGTVAFSTGTPLAVVTSLNVGNVVVNPSPAVTRVVRVSNPGALTINSFSVGLNGVGFGISTNDCSSVTSLAPNAFCDVTISVTPASSGSFMGALTASYDPGTGSTQRTLSLSGTGKNPASLGVMMGTGAENFGDVAVGATTAARTITIRNNGEVDATSIVFSGVTASTSPFARSATTCGATLAAGASCTYSVAFSSSTEGPKSATLVADYQTGRGAASPSFSQQYLANAKPAAQLLITALEGTDFGDVVIGTQSAYRGFQVKNEGGVTARITISGMSPIPSGQSFDGNYGTCSSDLAAGATCQINARFKPLAPGGPKSYNGLTLSYDPGTGSTISATPVVLSGNAKVRATLSLTGSSFPPTTVGDSVIQTVVLTHSGDVAATDLTYFPIVSAPFSTDTVLPFSIGPSSPTTINISVAFNPRTQDVGAGTVMRALTVRYADGLGTPTVTFMLSGTAVSPASLVIMPPMGSSAGFDFGTVAIGKNPTRNFSVVNQGGARAKNAVFSALTDGFSFPNGAFLQTSGGTCASGGAELAPGSSCTVAVRLTTTGSIERAASSTFRITYDAVTFQNGSGGISASETKQLTAQIVEPALLSLSPTSLAFGDVTVSGASSPRTVTVTNTKTGAATLGSMLSMFTSFSTSTGSTCTTGKVLQKNESCTLTYVFRPMSAGDAQATVNVPYDNGVADVSTSFLMTGYGMTPARLVVYTEEGELLMPGASYYMGEAPVGFKLGKVLMISNTGQSDATTLRASSGPTPPFRIFPNGTPFDGLSGNCGPVLSGTRSGGTTYCYVPVEFAPTLIQMAQTSGLTFAYANGSSSDSVSLSLRADGLAPRASVALSFQGSDYVFPSVPVGCAASANEPFSQKFTFTNNGQRSATVFATSTTGPFRVVMNTCDGTLEAPGESGSSTCFVRVAAEPPSHLPVSQPGTLVATYNDGQENKTLTLRLTVRSNDPAPLVGTFSLCGVRPHDLETVPDHLPHDGALDSSGRVIVSGLARFSTGDAGFVTRFGSDGVPDLTYGGSSATGGVVILSGTTLASAVATLPDGSAVVGVSRTVPGGAESGLVKLSSAGIVDTSFVGEDDSSNSADTVAVKVVVTSSGPIYLVSNKDGNVRVALFDAMGVLQWAHDFGEEDGMTLRPRDAVLVNGSDVLILSDHVGVKESILMRIQSDGTALPIGATTMKAVKFGTYTSAESHTSQALSLNSALSNPIVYVAGTKGPVYAVVAVFLDTGVPVSTMGTAGVGTFAPRALNSNPGLVLLPNGTILTAGDSAVGTSTDFFFGHWNASLAVPTTGIRQVDGYSSADYLATLLLASSGATPEVLLLGATWNPNTSKFNTYLSRVKVNF